MADKPIPNPQTIDDIAALYNTIDDRWFLGMIGGLCYHAHIENAPDEQRRQLYDTLQAIVDFVAECKPNPALWEPAARRRDELDEAELGDRGQFLGFGALGDYKPQKYPRHVDVMMRICATHYQVPAQYQRQVAWLTLQMRRCAHVERQDLPVWWVEHYSLVVETIVTGVGFPPGQFPPAPDDDDPPTLTMRDNIIRIDGGHRNRRKPRSEAA